MSRIKINDGLTKSERYRLKDVEAYRELKRNYAKTEPERSKRRDRQRKWRETNRERSNQLANESYHRHKEVRLASARVYHLRKNYGLTEEQYQDKLKQQNYRCAICKKHESKFKASLAVDHCHTTGVIRDLLCPNCNGNLGWFELNRETIINYLTKLK